MTIVIESAEQLFTGNGLTTAFTTAIYSAVTGDIDVYFLSTTTGLYTLQSTSSYVVSGLKDAAGVTVTFTVAPPNATGIAISRSTQYTQKLDFQNQRGYNVGDLETGLDRLAEQTQQVAEETSRSLRLSFGETATMLPTAAFRAGTYLGFDGAGVPKLLAASTLLDFATRAEFLAWDAVSNPYVGQVVRAGGYDYFYAGSGTAIPDLPGWIPKGLYCYGAHWGFPLTAGTNGFSLFTSMIGYMGGLDKSATLDGGGALVELSATIAPTGLSDINVIHFSFKPHTSWAYTPTVCLWDQHLPVIAASVTGAGPFTASVTVTGDTQIIVGDNITISNVIPTGYNGTWTALTVTRGATSTVTFTVPTTLAAWTSGGTMHFFPASSLFTSSCLILLGSGIGTVNFAYNSFDGRKDTSSALNTQYANFIMQTSGSSNTIGNTGVYCPDFGYWNANGNDQAVETNDFTQYKVSDANNQIYAKRTSALFVVASGDCTLRNNRGGYGRFSAVYTGTAGRSEGNHWVAGVPDSATGDVTTKCMYNVWVTKTGGPTLRNEQWDKGGLLAHGSAFTLTGIEPHLDDKFGTQNLRFVVFQPLETGSQLRGCAITGSSAVGKVYDPAGASGPGDYPRTSGQWFTYDTTYGTLSTNFDDTNTNVSSNIYKAGQGATQPIPSTQGTYRAKIRATEWVADGDGTWKYLSTAAPYLAYFDFSAALFLPDNFPWRTPWVSHEIKQTGNLSLGRLWLEKVALGQYKVRCDYKDRPDVLTVDFMWNYSNERGITGGTPANETDATIIELGGSTNANVFASRAAFVSWATGKTPAVGLVINAAGLGYRYIGTGTAISDLPGWVPNGIPQPGHWNAAGDGTTDDRAAFASMEAYGVACFIPKPSVGYKFTTTLNLTIAVDVDTSATWVAITDSGQLTWTGAMGGWTNVGVINTKQVDIHRFGGAVFVGGAADQWSGNSSAADGGTSWWSTAANAASYLGVNANLLTIGDYRPYGVVSLVRGSDVNGNNPIGFGGSVVNDVASKAAWGAILELQHESGASQTLGIEIGAKYKGGVFTTLNAYNSGAGIQGLWFAGGGDASFGGAATRAANTAMVVLKNAMSGLSGGGWSTALVVKSDALEGTDGGAASVASIPAIQLARTHTVDWGAPTVGALPTGSFGGRVVSKVVDANNAVQQVFLDDQVQFQNRAGTAFGAFIGGVSVVNRPLLYGANTGLPIIFQAGGSDTNISMRFSPKGTGGILVGASGSPSAAALLEVSSTTQGFLPPRMTTTQRDAIASPPSGLVLHNSTLDAVQGRANSGWWTVLPDFATRAAFVTYASGKTFVVGTTAVVLGLGYRYLGSGTAISDLAGWVAIGTPQPGHYAAAIDNVTDDKTPIDAAITYAAGVIETSPGTSFYNGAATGLAGRIIGAGVIRTTEGKRARHFSAITAAPSAFGNEGSVSTAFDGDWSKSLFPVEHRITGAATLGQPTSGYTYTPEAFPHYTYLFNSSGWNNSTTGNAGRTGAVAYRTNVYQAGQGDAVAYNASVYVTGAKAGATGNQGWLANPAGVVLNGQVTAGANGVYLNDMELNMQGGAFDCAAVGAVFNMTRNVNTGALGAGWDGIRLASIGTQKVDSAIRLTGDYNAGIVLSEMTGASQAAITIKQADRIYLRASDPGVTLFDVTVGDTYLTSGANGAIVSVGGQDILDVRSGEVRINKGVDSQTIARVLGASTTSYMSLGQIGDTSYIGAYSDAAANTTFSIRTAAAGVEADSVVIQQNGTVNIARSGAVLQLAGLQVLQVRITGWVVDTGTNKRSANTTYAGTAEVVYTQATIQTLMDAVRDQSQAMKALKADLFAHGLIGT